MGLDFVVLTDEGRSSHGVSLNRLEHGRFARRIEADYFPILNRLVRYFDDAEFSPSELPALKESFLAIQARVDDRDSQKMDSMIKLIDTAIEMGKPIKVIAD